jgi:hypothetical protein
LNLKDAAFEGLFEGEVCALMLGQKLVPVSKARLSPDGAPPRSRRR